MKQENLRKIVIDTREKYSGKTYKAETISYQPGLVPKTYAEKLLKFRLEMVRSHLKNGVVLDLCCGSGEHLFYFSEEISMGVGVDFSQPFLERAEQKRRQQNLVHLSFVEGDARFIPIQDNFFDVVYSISSLYHIPNVSEVVREVGRVLKPGGVCLLDFGNCFSLNTIVCKYYPETAQSFHISIPKMKKDIQNSGMEIIEHKSFQILPLWADRPGWLKPFLWQGWNNYFKRIYRGKMLDEWISSLPIIRFFAFRQVYLCVKK